MSEFQPPVPPQVVAVPMKDYLNHTNTYWSNDQLTQLAKRRWEAANGEAKKGHAPSYVLLTEEQAQAWRGGQ
jgi:hypothetical protein